MSRTPQQHRSPKAAGTADFDRFTARLPHELNDALQQRARANGRSANAELVEILRAAMAPEQHTCAEPTNGAMYEAH
ncbi:Arc-like DNA binding domain protein [compost metagenome]